MRREQLLATVSVVIAASLVWDSTGLYDPVRVRLLGDLADAPAWRLLERWPDVRMEVVFLNANGSARGRLKFGPGDYERVRGVRLRRTVDNDFHSRRIRTAVRPDDPDALTRLAEWTVDELEPRYGVAALMLAGDALEAAHRLRPSHASVLRLGTLRRRASDADGELRAYRAYRLDGRQSDPRAVGTEAEALLRLGAPAAAESLLRSVDLAAHPGERVLLAECRLALGDLDEALALFRSASAGHVEGPRIRALEGEARVHLRRGLLDEALRAARISAEADRASHSAANTLGAVLYCRGEFEEAVAEFRRALVLAPSYETRSRSNLGLALAASGRTEAAIEAFGQCLATDPLNLTAPWAGLAQVALARGDGGAGSRLLDRGLMHDPGSAWLRLRRARVSLLAGEPARALELATSVLRDHPDCADALALGGRAHAQMDDDRAAIVFLERAARWDPDDPGHVAHLATTLLRAGRPLDALTRIEASGRLAERSELRLLAALAAWEAERPVDEVLNRLAPVSADPSPAVQQWISDFRELVGPRTGRRRPTRR